MIGCEKVKAYNHPARKVTRTSASRDFGMLMPGTRFVDLDIP